MDDFDAARLVDLEVRYTYLERVVRDLDQVVVELRGEVARLRSELSHLHRIAADTGSSPGNEKPPHY
ncbi:MAG TPA: SlyX family protein [Polyangiaceae bacterium]|jgi:uncharacterized coiled-coil protein SlyX|nr:SlyX family protein [Polyangiaceae bacterium]